MTGFKKLFFETGQKYQAPRGGSAAKQRRQMTWSHAIILMLHIYWKIPRTCCLLEASHQAVAFFKCAFESNRLHT